MSESPELGRVYREDAERYDRLVSREDHAGNLLPALRRIAPLEGRTIVDLGAGTGRLTRLLAPPAGRIVGLDLSPAMLRVARDRLARARGAPWALAVADHRALPIAGASADVVAAGWTVCYTVLWTGEAWREHLDRAVGDDVRVRQLAAALRREGEEHADAAVDVDASSGEVVAFDDEADGLVDFEGSADAAKGHAFEHGFEHFGAQAGCNVDDDDGRFKVGFANKG